MKAIPRYIIVLALSCASPAWSHGQATWVPNDTITRLDEVVLRPVALNREGSGQYSFAINDSVVSKMSPLLSDVLRYHTPIFFRENGYGMVSSASFRGTSAAQTAVVWNGINFNSQFNGQTDFNTLNAAQYDDITVVPGGNSLRFGSGAMGGSVHLDNRFRFGEGSRHTARLAYGSFNTRFGRYGGRFSSGKTSVNLNLSRMDSDNDFPYPNTEQHNENGDFYHTALNAAIAHRPDDRYIFKFYSDFYDGSRGLSGTLFAPSNNSYHDRNSRNMLEWKGGYGDLISTLRLVYMDERYRYYENRHSDRYSFGHARNHLVRYDADYSLDESMTLSAALEYRYITGDGSDISDVSRNTGSAVLLFSHRFKKFEYDLGLRQEMTGDYGSPLLFSTGGRYRFSPNYAIRYAVSKNYRIPTFNDLYWTPGGNPDLQPETSFQGEVGQAVRLKSVELGLTVFGIRSTDLLRWVPDTDTGLWQPENTDSATNYGVELVAGWNGHHFAADLTYAWTRATDDTTGRMLIYTPEHKLTVSLAYLHKRWSFFYHFLYNGPIYTASDNSQQLDGYAVSDVGLYRTFLKNKNVRLGLQVRNLWNTAYESLPSRPMPGRSFNVSVMIEI